MFCDPLQKWKPFIEAFNDRKADRVCIIVSMYVRYYFLFREKKKLGSVGASGFDLSSRDAEDRRGPTSWQSESVASRHLGDDSQMSLQPAVSSTTGGSDL